LPPSLSLSLSLSFVFSLFSSSAYTIQSKQILHFVTYNDAGYGMGEIERRKNVEGKIEMDMRREALVEK